MPAGFKPASEWVTGTLREINRRADRKGSFAIQAILGEADAVNPAARGTEGLGDGRSVGIGGPGD